MTYVMVTGAAGFIGRHLVEELRVNGYRVAGVDRPDGDLTEPGVAEKLVETYQPEVVVHLAAAVGRLFGEDDVVRTVQTNAQATVLLARAVGATGARMIYASTSEVYGDRGNRVCRESSTMDLPHNLYGLSKRWGEEACALYAPRGLVTLRLSMPYGPGVPPGRGRAALPNILWQAHTRQPIPVHRGAERSWCWVGDTVRGIRIIMDRGAEGPFNVGRDDQPRSMLHVARKACAMTGAPETLIEEIDPPARQTVVKRLATDKLRRLGWQPEVDLDEGMELTLPWVQQFDAAGEPCVPTAIQPSSSS